MGNWDPPRLPQVSCRCCSLCPQGHLCPPGDAAPGCLAAGRGGRWKPVLSPSPCRGLPPPHVAFPFTCVFCLPWKDAVPPSRGVAACRWGDSAGLGEARGAWRGCCLPGPQPEALGWGFAGRSSSCFSSPLPSRLEGRGRGLDGSADLRPGDLLCKARVSLLR